MMPSETERVMQGQPSNELQFITITNPRQSQIPKTKGLCHLRPCDTFEIVCDQHPQGPIFISTGRLLPRYFECTVLP
jgi:hypothetical protein